MKKILSLCALPLLLSALACPSAARAQQALSMREQARVVDELLDYRYEHLLPSIMASTGIDMWIVVAREYNEDPVLKTMLPADWLSARRRTIFVFYRNPATGVVDKLAVARYGAGGAIKAAWDVQKFPDQWDALVDIVRARRPDKIGIDVSRNFAHADGLAHTDYTQLMQKLPPEFRDKVVSAEPLAIRWLETRSEREMQIYPQLVHATHQIIAEGFSEQVITPGVTTASDLQWWFRQKIRDLGYDTWFHPSVEIQRQGKGGSDPDVIIPGDLLHVDIGITYLRLNTDIQEHAYILKPGETAAPAELQRAFASAHRLQDILTAQFSAGRSGNEILAGALAQARKEGIRAAIYSHPLGYHGHAAGPSIGLWDRQDGVPGSGDEALRPHTVYAIELSAAATIASWQQDIRIMLEQDGYFDGAGVRYLDGRQLRMHLVPRQPDASPHP